MPVFFLKNRFLIQIFLIQKDYNTTWYVSKSKHDYLLMGDKILEFFYCITLQRVQLLLIEIFLLQNYLKFEQSSGMPARVQVLYERAIADFPISPDLWLDYTCYLDKTLKVLIFLFVIIIIFTSPYVLIIPFHDYNMDLFSCFSSFSRLVILSVTFTLGPLRIALGLDNFGFSTCFPWNVFMLLRKTWLKYVFGYNSALY